MAQLRYPPNNYYRKIEATIRKDFMNLPDNNGVGYVSTMFKMAGERHTFDIHEGSQYSYHCIEAGWYWDIAWLEDIVVLEESSNEEEEDEE